MASFSPTAAVDSPRVALDDHGILPPVQGGDGGDSEPGSPNYRTGLARPRLGLLVALIPVFMLFVSFTSAYIVRQGLPTLDSRTNQMVLDWIPVRLPALLLLNTCILLFSTATMELARRQIKRQAALSPAESRSENSLGDTWAVPWLPVTVLLGIGFLVGQWRAWAGGPGGGFLLCTHP